MPMQDAFGLTDHLARDGGLIVNAFLHHVLSHDKWTAIRIILAFEDTANHFAGLVLVQFGKQASQTCDWGVAKNACSE
jgi:hypothetical protein